MHRKIKVIWDFRGPAAQKTAEHHTAHLKEYAQIEKMHCDAIAAEHFSDFFSIAFMIIDERELLKVRDSLKPHRAELADSLDQ